MKVTEALSLIAALSAAVAQAEAEGTEDIGLVAELQARDDAARAAQEDALKRAEDRG